MGTTDPAKIKIDSITHSGTDENRALEWITASGEIKRDLNKSNRVNGVNIDIYQVCNRELHSLLSFLSTNNKFIRIATQTGALCLFSALLAYFHATKHCQVSYNVSTGKTNNKTPVRS